MPGVSVAYAYHRHAPPPPEGDPQAVAAGARAFHAAAEAMDRASRELTDGLATLTQGPGSWQGSASQQFTELSGALHSGTTKFADNFRELAGSLSQLADGLEQAQEKRREAEIAAVVGGLLLIGAIVQLGLDPADDAATGAALAETTALAGEATATAAAATATASRVFLMLSRALVAVRGLTAFLAVTHLGAGALAGTQMILITWLAGGKINWDEVGTGVLFATVTDIPLGSAGKLLLKTLRREGVSETEAMMLARQLERDAQADSAAARGLNAAGKRYPDILDPRTGKPIPLPEGASRPVPPDQRVPYDGRQDRAAYIKEWYKRGYKTPEGGWDQYELHHIKPREFGGTNDFENMVPLKEGDHAQFTDWWRVVAGR